MIDNKYNFSLFRKICIFSLVIIFSGFFGFIYEYIFYYFNSGMKIFYMRGGNFLPWINIYAIGSLLVWLFLYRYKKNPLKVFILSMFTTGVLEYFAGLLLYVIGDGMRCWDYNTEILSFGSLNGFVCIRSVLLFGIFSLMLIYLVLPWIFWFISRCSTKVLYLIIILVLIILFDEVYNLVLARILSLPRASDIYKVLGFKYMNFN